MLRSIPLRLLSPGLVSPPIRTIDMHNLNAVFLCEVHQISDPSTGVDFLAISEHLF